MTAPEQATLVGVMSGTSRDGVTAAVARFRSMADGCTVELLGFETLPYADAMRERLRAASDSATAAEYNALSFALGERFAEAAAAAIASAGVARADIAAVASHGHTIWHAPPAGTWQLGEGAVVAERLGIAVIEDFRVRDVAAGGEGAPLVPIADALLFGRPDAPRALQNIGGIGNVTIVPRRGELAGVRAFDTGPGVVLIDATTAALFGDRFDRDGQHARSGRPVEVVVERLLGGDFFRREPPKSTGRETFSDEYARALVDACRLEQPDCSNADVVATATELTARSIADALHRFVPEPVADVLVSGGGAENRYLVERIAALVAPTPLLSFSDEFIPGESKEAVAFAFLGFLYLRGAPGNVPGATGARGPRILGKLVPA